jgi:circadian clock protein KaiB
MSGTLQDPMHYQLRLVVAGVTDRSRRTIARVKSVCDTHLAGHYDLEVIDIYQQPELAKLYQVIAAPSLVRLLPLPVRVISDLSQEDRILHCLNLVPP